MDTLGITKSVVIIKVSYLSRLTHVLRRKGYFGTMTKCMDCQYFQMSTLISFTVLPVLYLYVSVMHALQPRVHTTY